MSEESAVPTRSDSENVVSKTITVASDVGGAFRTWTEQIHRWWPSGHSISGDPATRVILEGREGGRFFERTSAGIEYDWGRILLWDPPHRLIFHWFLGSGPHLPTRVEVQFIPLNPQTTRVHLEHRGPEVIGALWWTMKGRYSAAWDVVLGRFGEM